MNEHECARLKGLKCRRNIKHEAGMVQTKYVKIKKKNARRTLKGEEQRETRGHHRHNKDRGG